MNKRKRTLLTIGQMCKEHRERLGIKQSQVADDTGYSEQNISSFETGRTNNMFIFLWYIDKGVFNPYNKNLIMLHHLLRG